MDMPDWPPDAVGLWEFKRVGIFVFFVTFPQG